ncbi:MAG: T9SS type A sorting domain-containing protein [Chitinophagales bacterium]|nr:T9SS type A sorting domain-containing protein [Chitinophagales bacterium]
MRKTTIIYFIFSIIGLEIQAQQGTVSAGGDGNSNNGSISYSIGQVDYTNSSSSDGSFNLGIQQPYDIFPLEIENLESINSISIYPNPVDDQLIVKLVNLEGEDVKYEIFDLKGLLIKTDILESSTQFIDMSIFPSAVYFLSIKYGSQIRTFKIQKK